MAIAARAAAIVTAVTVGWVGRRAAQPGLVAGVIDGHEGIGIGDAISDVRVGVAEIAGIGDLIAIGDVPFSVEKGETGIAGRSGYAAFMTVSMVFSA